MLYLFWVTHPPFGFDLYPLLSCWDHCQMFIQPVYVVKEWEIAESGECPFCRLQRQISEAASPKGDPTSGRITRSVVTKRERIELC